VKSSDDENQRRALREECIMHIRQMIICWFAEIIEYNITSKAGLVKKKFEKILPCELSPLNLCLLGGAKRFSIRFN
jgi:hypothetical protein